MRYNFIFIALIIATIIPQPSLAAEFNPNLILTDAELTDYGSMSPSDIQKFLEYKGSPLSRLKTRDIDNVKKPAAKIIYEAAQRYKINPRYLLVLLQKEQSLIIGSAQNLKNRLAWATGYGMCDSCSKQDAKIQKFKGFAKQIDNAAGANRFYIENPDKFNIKVGTAITIDDSEVIPQNQATANQYIYTPHLHGNKNLWRIWREWFTRMYPSGALLQAKGDPTIYLVRRGKKHAFASYNAFITRYKIEEVIQVEASELDNYETGDAIKFANYSLLRLPNGIVYLIVDNEKKPIASTAVLSKLGYNPDEIIDVEKDEVAIYKTGKFITMSDSYPTGAVLQNKDTGELYYVYEGKRKFIMNEFVAKNRFPERLPIKVDNETLKQFPLLNETFGLKDGTLVKTEFSPDVYIISDGRRRLLPNNETFTGLGFKESNIITIDETTMLLHPKGEPVLLNNNNDA